jgi:hypothetical protein
VSRQAAIGRPHEQLAQLDSVTRSDAVGGSHVRLPEKTFEWHVRGWRLGVTLCAGIWQLSVWWDGNPFSLAHPIHA